MPKRESHNVPAAGIKSTKRNNMKPINIPVRLKLIDKWMEDVKFDVIHRLRSATGHTSVIYGSSVREPERGVRESHSNNETKPG
jgi:hypothetical protein